MSFISLDFVSTAAAAKRRRALTHLYIVAFALAWAAAAAGQSARELLNSERIAAAFGSYGVEVLEQGGDVRVSSLYSGAKRERICRTFAIVRYAPGMDAAVRDEHAAIVAGGSIGAVFAAAGWAVRKTHLRYGERAASARLAALMKIEVGTPLAEHIYALHVEKDGRAVEYAALVEIHHPDYLRLPNLAPIYGPVDESRQDLVTALRATADERTR
jgi:hypothetical protein